MLMQSIASSRVMWSCAALLLVLLAPCARKAVMSEKAESNSGNEVEEVIAAPPITLEVAREYWLGFPMIVAVTVSNSTPQRTFYHLPECDLFTTTGPVEFLFTSGSDVVRFGAASRQRREGPPRGFTLRPGESRRMLFDLAGLEPQLHAGTWRVEARYHASLGASVAPPVTVRIVQPEEADAQAAVALRRDNDVKTASWLYFLQANWRTVNPAGLSARGRAALALHLFLHRAIYGPQPVAELRAEDLQMEGATEAEAAIYRLEILTARKDTRAAAEASALLTKWPGMRWRVEEVNKSEGLLTRARQAWGAERSDKPPGPVPYAN
jgi:hypothetical protein